MLTLLKVKNYALIRELSFSPGGGFNAVTGETGAGKSILLGALGLILGDRADSLAIREHEDKCVVEGVFQIGGYQLENWFEEQGFDHNSELILRREIQNNGKSRAFINDTPAQLSQLKELGKFLIDIHSQHDNLDLFQKAFQFSVLDCFSGNDKLFSDYTRQYSSWKKLKVRLQELTNLEQKGNDERSFKQFLLDELISANLAEGEAPKLEAEILALSSAEENLRALDQIVRQLNESESSILDGLAMVRSRLSSMARMDPRFTEYEQEAGEAYYNLRELASGLEKMSGSLSVDPERLGMLNDRLNLLNQLEKKHRTADLIARRFELEDELAVFENLEAEIESCRMELSATETNCLKLAAELAQNREAHKADLETRVNEAIEYLGMPGAAIKVEINDLSGDHPGTYGTQDCNMLFSPARGKSFNPIQNIASGGEISRLMLVLKSVLAAKKAMPTIIFDEIDTGVSGEVAVRMGEVLAGMSETMQLIVITHLPQIAARGKKHFHVYKKSSGETVSSDIRELSSEERILEIAEMLAGKSVSEATMATARQLLA